MVGDSASMTPWGVVSEDGIYGCNTIYGQTPYGHWVFTLKDYMARKRMCN